MAFTSKQVTFTPVILFTPETQADHLAIAMVHSLYRDVRETMDTERSRQQEIGISEIGADCRRCVARKLSMLYVKPQDPSWKAQVGTFIHAGLEEHFVNKYGEGPHQLTLAQKRVVDIMHAVPAGPGIIPTDERPVYYMERHLHVHDHGKLHLGGSCDMFIEGATFGLVVDWKTQGPSKLKKTAAAQIPRAYMVQMPTYGLGWELLGKKVTHLVLYALPRDGELAEAKPVLMRYDRQVAIDALAELDNLIDAAELLERIYPGHGWEKLIDAQVQASGCWDCRGFEKAEGGNFFAEMFD